MDVLLLSLAGHEQVLSAQPEPPALSSALTWHKPHPQEQRHNFIHNLYQMLKLGPWDPEPAVMLHCP